MSTFLGIVFFIVIVFAVIHGVKKGATETRAGATGAAKIICPHCQSVGTVNVQSKKVKQGISGGKATGAVLTGGLSLLATGLSKKQKGKQLTCGNCHMSWFVA